MHGGDLHLRRSAGRGWGRPQSMPWAVRARSHAAARRPCRARGAAVSSGRPQARRGRAGRREETGHDGRHPVRAPHRDRRVLQPARGDGVRRGPRRGAHRPAHRHDRRRLRRARGQGGDVPRQDRLGLRRGAGRSHARGLLLLPREGARGDAAVSGRARARRPARARPRARLPQPLPAGRRARRGHLPREALPAAERVHARDCWRRRSARRSTSPAAPSASTPA